MAERVDLDAVMARHVAGSFEESQADVPVLVAECKAGRRVVEAAREWCGGEQKLLPRRVAQALDAYDQATGQPDPAAGHASPEGVT